MDSTTFINTLEWTMPIVLIVLLSRWTIAQILKAAK